METSRHAATQANFRLIKRMMQHIGTLFSKIHTRLRSEAIVVDQVYL